MKTDVNGVSQCQKSTENYETFYTTIRRKKTKLVQYDYRNEDGELFSCVKPTKEGENDINRGTTGNVER